MSLNPKVSIVIPVYNGSDYLREAIDSALAQTYPNIEIVVVNDGSRDEGATESIALSYGDKLRYFYKENGGVASALNRAITEMTGDYFAWLSHDDLYYPNKIETQVQALSVMDDARTILYSDFVSFSHNPDSFIEMRLTNVSPEKFRYSLTIGDAVHGCTLLIPREAFVECGSFDEKLRATQDFDLWFRMAEKFHFVHIPEVLVMGRQHEAQGSNTMKDISLAECNVLLDYFVGNLSSQEITTASNNSLSVAYAKIFISFWRRGFYRSAAKKAFLLSMKNWRSSSIKDLFQLVTMLSSFILIEFPFVMLKRILLRYLINIRNVMRVLIKR